MMENRIYHASDMAIYVKDGLYSSELVMKLVVPGTGPEAQKLQVELNEFVCRFLDDKTGRRLTTDLPVENEIPIYSHAEYIAGRQILVADGNPASDSVCYLFRTSGKRALDNADLIELANRLCEYLESKRPRAQQTPG